MRQPTDDLDGRTSPPSPSAMRRVESFARSAQERSVEERQLVDGARHLLRARLSLAKLIPHGLIRESSWDMMLILFINGEEGGIVYIKQLIIASGEAPATAMRKIDRLEQAKMLERVPDTLDHRRVIVQLTARGRDAMLLMLKDVFLSSFDRDVAPVVYKPPNVGIGR